jgi:GNAT superfamily N-acetyltransferase
LGENPRYKKQARTLIRKNQSDLYDKEFEDANLKMVDQTTTNFPYVAVLEKEGQIPLVVGFAAIDTGEVPGKRVLFNLVVNEDYRKKGIGASLLDFLLNKYKDINLDPSEGAEKWYKSFASKRRYNYFKQQGTGWWTMSTQFVILDDDDDDVAEVTLTVSNWEKKLADVDPDPDPDKHDRRKVTNLNTIPDMSSFKKAVDSVRGNDYKSWLTDDFMNEYIQLLSKENRPPLRPTSIKSFTKLLFPIHINDNHWVLLYMEPTKDKTMVYYLDPYRKQTLPTKVTNVAETFLRAAELPEMSVQPLIPYKTQTDAHNCGVFVLQYMKHIALYNDPDTFLAKTEEDFKAVRKRMIQEIIEQELIVDTKRTTPKENIFFGTTVFSRVLDRKQTSTLEKEETYQKYINKYINKINSR